MLSKKDRSIVLERLAASGEKGINLSKLAEGLDYWAVNDALRDKELDFDVETTLKSGKHFARFPESVRQDIGKVKEKIRKLKSFISKKKQERALEVGKRGGKYYTIAGGKKVYVKE